MGDRDPRVLVVDDDLGVIASYRHVFERLTRARDQSSLASLEEELFGRTAIADCDRPVRLAIDYADCGASAIRNVKAAQHQGAPFAVIFLDMRMPPGIDGLTTAEAIRRVDQQAHIIFVTGFSDYDERELAERVQPADRLHFLRKPVPPGQLRKVATALTALWTAERSSAEPSSVSA
jgi:CheY-like chemotaxis protein